MRETCERTIDTIQGIYRESFTQGIPIDHAVELITQRARSKSVVALEGSPIYLYPDTAAGYFSQQWHHGAFTGGWEFVSQLHQRLQVEGVRSVPFVLVDEFNNLPEGYTDRNFMQRFAQLVTSSTVIEYSPIANPGEGDSQVVYRLESEFTRPEEDDFNVCSNLDAGFQKEKIIFTTSSLDLPLVDALNQSRLIVVHPEEFKSQQSLMLTSLLGEMKHPPFNQIPKSQRREILSEIYQHVWFDRNRNIVGITHPVWDGHKFIHEEVEG